MALYEFICKTPQGKEVRGECRAKNAEDLAATLRETGLTLQWCQEKRTEDRVVSRAFAKEVAGIMKTLGEPRQDKSSRTLQEKLQLTVIVVGLMGGGMWLYTYLDNRIDRLEDLAYRPPILKEIHKYTEDLPQ